MATGESIHSLVMSVFGGGGVFETAVCFHAHVCAMSP